MACQKQEADLVEQFSLAKAAARVAAIAWAARWFSGIGSGCLLCLIHGSRLIRGSPAVDRGPVLGPLQGIEQVLVSFRCCRSVLGCRSGLLAFGNGSGDPAPDWAGIGF